MFNNYVIKFKPDNYVPHKISSYKVIEQDLDSERTKRNLKGILFRDRIAIIPDLEVEVPYLNESQMNELLTRLRPVKFQVEYWDPYSQTYKTNYFYCPSSGRAASILKYNPLTYESLKFRLVGYNNV